MKNIMFLWLFSTLAALTACANAPPSRQVDQAAPAARLPVCQLPAALREIFRGGELAPLQYNDGQALGMPSDYDLVSHTCTSTPIFYLDGRYRRTSVKCW